MMETIIFEVLKVGGPTAAVSIAGFFILKEILKHMEKKDDRVALLVSNHLNHNTQALQQLQIAIKELVISLRNGNKK